jgi:hypothetical protein
MQRSLEGGSLEEGEGEVLRKGEGLEDWLSNLAVQKYWSWINFLQIPSS